MAVRAGMGWAGLGEIDNKKMPYSTGEYGIGLQPHTGRLYEFKTITGMNSAIIALNSYNRIL